MAPVRISGSTRRGGGGRLVRTSGQTGPDPRHIDIPGETTNFANMDTPFYGAPAIGRFAQFKLHWRKSRGCDTFSLFNGGLRGEFFDINGLQKGANVGIQDLGFNPPQVQRCSSTAVYAPGGGPTPHSILTLARRSLGDTLPDVRHHQAP